MNGRSIALVVAGLFLALFFPSYVVQWIGYVIVATVGLSFAYSRSVHAGLEIDREESSLRAYQHQVVTVRIRIRNTSPLPVPHLVVTDNPGSLYTGEENSRLMSLRGKERTELVYDIRGMNRGAYRIGPITVRYADPLGLYPAAETIMQETRLVVYPHIYPVELPVHRGLPAGSITTTSRIYEDPTRYRSVREYVPGDEIRRINWKASARLGELHSTEWLPTINVPVMILLNLTASTYEQRNRYRHTERTIDAAASLVHHLVNRSQEVGLVTTGLIRGAPERIMPFVRVGAGTAHAVGILETLAQLETNDLDEDPVARFLERGAISYGTRLFYLGAPLHPDSVAALVSSMGDRSLLRLYYTDEGVANWDDLSIESVRVYRITEHGDELFAIQT
ncbi:MAG: DUF58 domain-containing protein [Spirochaetota bacterium]